MSAYDQAMLSVKSTLVACSDWLGSEGFAPKTADVLAMARLVFEREARYREQELTAENHAAWRKMDDELAALSTRPSRVSGSAQ